jgi:hypothetical protein
MARLAQQALDNSMGVLGAWGGDMYGKGAGGLAKKAGGLFETTYNTLSHIQTFFESRPKDPNAGQ